MNVLEIIGGVLLLLSSILMIILVVKQGSKQSGLSAMSGQSDSYLSHNRGKTLESKIVKLTRILVVIFFATSLAMNLIIRYAV